VALQAPQLKSNRETSANSLRLNILPPQAASLLVNASKIKNLQTAINKLIHILSMSTGDILLHESEQRPSLIQCDRF
jgi:hypothetical protein